MNLKKLIFTVIILFSVVFYINVYASNETIKEETKQIYVNNCDKHMSLYDYLTQESYEWGWLFDLHTEDVIKFVEDPCLKTLTNISWDMKAYNSDTQLNLMSLIENKEENPTIDEYMFEPQAWHGNFYYHFDYNFINFIKQDNLQNILNQNGINEEILNYALLQVNSYECSIIWLQTEKIIII